MDIGYGRLSNNIQIYFLHFLALDWVARMGKIILDGRIFFFYILNVLQFIVWTF